MKKKINIKPYDSNWPKLFQTISESLMDILKDNCIKIYHIGSTSVPGLCAKPVIDILCIVEDLHLTIPILKEAGYTYKGEFNLPLRLFFNKKNPYDINLHIVNEDNGEIEWQIVFRDYLRNNKDARDLYGKTKIDLIKGNPDGFNILQNQFSEYTVLKGEVIRKISQQAGFGGYRFVIVNNYNEIEAYKKLMELQEIDFDNKNIFHLCLYKGVEVVAAACIQFDSTNATATINSVKSFNQKDEEILRDKIYKWTQFHNLVVN